MTYGSKTVVVHTATETAFSTHWVAGQRPRVAAVTDRQLTSCGLD